MFLPFLKNPFATKNLSRQDFFALLTGCIDRLNGQNTGGRYTAMVAALVPHRDGYTQFLGDQDLNLGGQYGNTDGVDKVMADFKAFAKDELLVDVAYVFGRKKPNPEALTAFLPKGRSEYSGATLGTLPVLLERVATLTTTHKTDLGNELAARATALQTAYTAARKTQGESKGEVQGDSKEEKKLRKAAARQLKLNLLDQLKLHIDEPEAVKALYDPRIFTRPKKTALPPPAK